MGATGVVGRRVVSTLAEAGVAVRATSRDPRAAAIPSAEVVPTGTDAAALVEGCDAVLVTTSALGDAPESRLAELLAAAVGHVVLLSSASAADPESPTGERYRPLEALVTGSPAPWTVVRSVPFALNTAHWWAAAIRAGGTVETPFPDVPTAPVDERDVADALAAALTGPALRRTITLTGPHALSSRRQIAAIGDRLGRTLEVRAVSPDEVRARLGGAGVPRWAVDGLLRSFAHAQEHGIAVTDAVPTLAGHPARSYVDWVADNDEAFR